MGIFDKKSVEEEYKEEKKQKVIDFIDFLMQEYDIEIHDLMP